MKKVRVLTAEEAALLVQDGDTISTGGFVSCAAPRRCPSRWRSAFLRPDTPET